MAKIFFLVSGENPTLPFSEIESILKAEGHKYRVLKKFTQLLRIEADVSCVNAVKFRSALARAGCLEIFNCKAAIDEILTNVEKMNVTEFLDEGGSYVVRVTRVRGASPSISCFALERKIGEIIFNRAKCGKVNLRKPDKTFFGVLTNNMFFFGLKLAEIEHKDLWRRRPRKRVFFHPAALAPKIARCMVNLAQSKAGDLVLDPFCGTGSLLIEAGLMGCRVIGFDVKRYMAEGSLKNLRFFGVEPEWLAVADARRPPLATESVDRIVTDPPYGTAASTLGFPVRELIESFFSAATNILRDEGMICIAAPETIKIHEIGPKYGFKHLESHFIYVHRRLTREIAVFKRQG